MAFDRRGIGDIVGGDGLVGAAEEYVGRKFATYNGDIRRKMHAQHAQHALFVCFVFCVLCVFSLVTAL